MVRNHRTIEKRLKRINSTRFKIEEKFRRLPWWAWGERKALTRELEYNQGYSYGLAYSINKVEHDKRGDHHSGKAH